MESIKKVFRIGMGPSSSHTMGPKRASAKFKLKYPDADSYQVTLYGSLALTGKGHLTDKAIFSELDEKKTKIIWNPNIFLKFHPNGLKFEALKGKKVIGSGIVFSVGGGDLWVEKWKRKPFTYHHKNMTEVMKYTDKNSLSLWEYVYKYEPGIEDHLKEVWKTMKEAIERGLNTEGLLPGILKMRRKASSYYIKTKNTRGFPYRLQLLSTYALAVSEENASGGKVVTAPTCGACGILPSVLLTLQERYKLKDEKIYHALATAGLIGAVVKRNGSVSGADVGCQGEVGVACAMAAAAATQLLGGSNHQIEYAAETGLEHHLGLTCDPVAGLVQLPCIERNAVGSVRAVESAALALLSDGRHLISFDEIVKIMLETGHDLQTKYKETAQGGIAKVYSMKKRK